MTDPDSNQPGTDDPTAAVLRPVTGDRAVDDALTAFDDAPSHDPTAQLAAAAEAHRVLQARLTAPVDAPSAPGEARPRPQP